MPNRRILILVPTLQANDAVGHDVLGMREVYRDAGYDVGVWAQVIHPSCEAFAETVRGAKGPWSDPDSVVIYHHAIAWELGQKILARAKGRIVIKHHNVTPPHFFEGYCEEFRAACARGIAATDRLAHLRGVMVWGDSRFNCEEFMVRGVEVSRCRSVPPCHRVEDLVREPIDVLVTSAFRGLAQQLLFVGAFRPNKGHMQALEVFAAYLQRSGRPARLIFVGNLDPKLTRYLRELQELAGRLGLSDAIHFAVSVSPRQLRAFYTLADLFLCLSAHEGFCVPLVEAMAFRVPIVAWNRAAVGETLGDVGIACNDADPKGVAVAIEKVLQDPVQALAQCDAGRQRYESVYHPQMIRRRLLEVLEEVIA